MHAFAPMIRPQLNSSPSAQPGTQPGTQLRFILDVNLCLPKRAALPVPQDSGRRVCLFQACVVCAQSELALTAPYCEYDVTTSLVRRFGVVLLPLSQRHANRCDSNLDSMGTTCSDAKKKLTYARGSNALGIDVKHCQCRGFNYLIIAFGA